MQVSAEPKIVIHRAGIASWREIIVNGAAWGRTRFVGVTNGFEQEWLYQVGDHTGGISTHHSLADVRKAVRDDWVLEMRAAPDPARHWYPRVREG